MMNSPYETLVSLVSPEIVERLGWLLVHSLWQFALIAMAAFVLERAMRRYSAGARYSLLMAAMLLIVFAPICTWWLLPERASGLVATRVEYPNPQFRLSEIADPKQAATHSSATASAADSLATPISNEDVLHAATAMPETSVRQWWSRLNAVLSPWLTAIVAVWIAGVLMFSVRPILSWFTVRRLRTVGVAVVDDAVQQATVRIKRRLGLRRRAHVLQSTLVNAPIVVGCFRSVILLPPSLLLGLPMSQLEAILAHELAHVRRYDYVVNLGQTLIETLFFYHPAVWWLSNRIRIERENCCDDLVVEALGDRVRYGRALLAIEEYRGSALALSARGGSLLSRVRRLWQIEKPDRSRPAGIVAGLSFLCLLVTMLSLWLVVLGGEPASVAEESQAERDSAAELAAWDALDLMPITVYGPAAQRQSLRQQIRNMEQANFPENAIRSFRQQLQQPVRSAEFWNVPADAWIQIGRLASLEELRIVASDLRGKPTEEIGRLASLRRLTVINSKCNPQDLSSLDRLALLEHVDVMFTVLDESAAWRKEQLGELTADEQSLIEQWNETRPNRGFIVEAAILTDRALDSLRGLKRLRTLRLANTYVSGQGLESLKSLPAIEGLDLTLIEFTPAAARIVGGLRTLKRFRYADAADETLAELTSLSELEDLELWSGGVTDQGVDHLLKLSKLRKLAIRGSQLSDAGLLRLADLPRLVSLDIGHASGSLSAVGIKRFQEQKPQCKVTFEQSGIDNADKPDRNEDKLPREPPDSASANVLWGEPVEGLRLGIRSAPYAKSATRFRYGDWLRYEIWIRNETTAPIHIPRDGRNYYRPALKDRVVNLVGGGGWGSFAVPIEVLDQATLTVPAGQSAPLLLVPSVQTPVQALGMPRGRYGYTPLELSLGKHQVLSEQNVSYLPGGVFDRNRRDFKSVNLRSAAVEIEVLPAARLQVTEANELAGDWTREYVDEDKSLRIVEVESGGNGKMKIVLNPNYEVLLDNEDIAKAEAKPVVGDEAHFAVHLELTAQAAERFARETKRIAERGGVPGRSYSKADGATRQVARQPDPTLRLAVLLDGNLLSAPRLIEPITGGKVMITGNFTRDQADALATAVRPTR